MKTEDAAATKNNSKQEPLQQLTEHIQDWNSEQVQIDEPQKTIRHIALSGLKSKNGYRYSEQALKDAVPLYEGKPVFLDHAANQSRPQDRSTRDLVGSIVNVRFHDERIRGDIQTLPTEAGKTFMALAAANNPSVGMSHVVLAHRSKDKTTVEQIHDVVSVDAVVFPATTSTFQEKMNSALPNLIEESVESVLNMIDSTIQEHVRNIQHDTTLLVQRVACFPESVLVEAHAEQNDEPHYLSIPWSFESGHLVLGEEIKHLEPDDYVIEAKKKARDISSEYQIEEQLKLVTEQRDQLQQELIALEQDRENRLTKETVEEVIETAGLPEYALSDSFRQLLEQADDRSRQLLVQDRLDLVSRSKRQSPSSCERLSEDRNDTDDAILKAFKNKNLSVLTGMS